MDVAHAQAGAADIAAAAGCARQRVVAQFIAGQHDIAGIEQLAGAGILVGKLRRAGHAQRVAGHRITKRKGRVFQAQRPVIDLAAADGQRQDARRDGERGAAGIADVVFGRPQAAQRIGADVQCIAVAGRSIGRQVAIGQAHIAEAAREAGQLAVIHLAAAAGGGDLQWRQKSFQHRRGIAVVDAPDGILAKIEAAETALLLHLRGRAATRAALVEIGTGGFIVEKGRPHAGARIGPADHGAHRAGDKTAARHIAAEVQPAGAAAGHAPADHAADILARYCLVAVDGQANGASGIGVGNGAAVAPDQAADIGRAAHAAGGVRLRNGAVVIAGQAADLLARAADGAAGARHADAAATVVGTDQAADHGSADAAAAHAACQARDIAAGAGIADAAAVAAGQAADIAVAADRHAAAHVAERAFAVVAHQRADVIAADDAAACHVQIADSATLHPGKQAAAEVRGIGAAIDDQALDAVIAAIKNARVGKFVAAEQRRKTGARVPAGRAPGVDVTGQQVIGVVDLLAGALQAVHVDDLVRRGHAAVATGGAQERAAAYPEAAGEKRRQAGGVLHPAAAVEQKVAAHIDSAGSADGAALQGQILGHRQRTVQVDAAATVERQRIEGGKACQVESALYIERAGKVRAADGDSRCADGAQLCSGQAQAGATVGSAAAHFDAARVAAPRQADRAIGCGGNRLCRAAQGHVVGHQADRAARIQAAAGVHAQGAAGRGAQSAAVLAQRHHIRHRQLAAGFQVQVAHAGGHAQARQVDRCAHRQVARRGAADGHGVGGNTVQFVICQSQAIARFAADRDLAPGRQWLDDHFGIAAGAAEAEPAAKADIVSLQGHQLAVGAAAEQLVATAAQIDAAQRVVGAQGQIAVAHIDPARAIAGDAGARQISRTAIGIDACVQHHIGTEAIRAAAGRIVGRQGNIAALRADRCVDDDGLASQRRQAHA